MSNEIEPAEGPRRGGRERKQVTKFDPGKSKSAASSKGKQKAVATEEDGDDDDDGQEQEESDLSEVEDPAPSRPNKRTANGSKKSAVKSTTRRPKKNKNNAEGDAPEPVAGEAENGFKVDSSFFNAMLSPDIALASLVEEWVEIYQQSANDEVSEKASVHEIILFFVRCCGLTADVDEDEAMDVDGVVDVIERLQDESVKVTAAAYPLISKAKVLKPFRANLDLFITHLIKTLAITPLLFENEAETSHSIPIISLLLTWLNSMATSSLRPIRHTSTHFILKIVSELCDVAFDVSKDVSLKQRQKETELKKGGTGAAYQKRIADAESKVKEAQKRRKIIEQTMQDTFSASIVHRLRDSDAAIRADCLKEMSQWIKRYPQLYVRTSFLLYLSKGVNDPNAQARLEAVKSLVTLASKEIGESARNAVLKTTPRLLEMSLRDVDYRIRVSSLKALTLVDRSGMLEDDHQEERHRIAGLIYDHDSRVRNAVAEFFLGLWTERVESLENSVSNIRVGRKKKADALTPQEERARLEWKALSTLLLETSQGLDDSESSTPSSRSIAARATAAVEALRSGMAQLQHWEQLADYMLLDHSSSKHDLWPLADAEEDLMIQVLVACVKADSEENQNEKSKTLMKILPRLFAKHHTSEDRMSALMTLLSQINLSLYLDLRMTAAYESLWDDVVKQLLHSNESSVLTSAIQAINELSSNLSMETTNKSKLAELQDNLFASLRDAIHGQEVIMMDLIDDEELATFESILSRISLLLQSRDSTEAVEDEEGGQSSAWEIVSAFAQRGSLGRKGEANIVSLALKILFTHLTWLLHKFGLEDPADEAKKTRLIERRDRVVEICVKLLLDQNTNSTDSVRREAFNIYLNIHVIFSSKSPVPAAQANTLEIAQDIQHKLGGAFQAAIDQYQSDREGERQARGDDHDEEGDDDLPIDKDAPEKVEQEMTFMKTLAAFVAAVRCGALDLEQAKEALTHFGRFGATFDAIVRKLVDVLRDEGIYNNDANGVQAVASEALQSSFSIFLDGNHAEPIAPIALAKLLHTAFVIQGTHFTVLRHMSSNEVFDFHHSCITYIFQRVSNYVRQSKSKESKARGLTNLSRALTFFKALLHLTSPIAGQQALKLKSHMEERLQELGVTINSNKMWDHYKAYERRLVHIASKDPNVKMASRKIASRAEEIEPTDGESEEEGTPVPVRSTPKTLSRGSKRSRGPRDSSRQAEDVEEGTDEVNGMEVNDAEPAHGDRNGSQRQEAGSPTRSPIDGSDDLNFGEEDFNMENIDIDAEFDANSSNGQREDVNDDGEEALPEGNILSQMTSLSPPPRARTESVEPANKRKRISRRL